MNDNYEISLGRIKDAISSEFITTDLKNTVESLNQRVSQIVVNDNKGNLEYFLTSLHDFFSIIDDKVTKYVKEDVDSVAFIKAVPHGEVIIKMKDGQEIHPSNLVSGRGFDFIQDIKPKIITMAGYDNTIRGEFPQLLDPDHAEEVDKLRRWMQDGHISHYEYDDANPVYPKAGK